MKYRLLFLLVSLLPYAAIYALVWGKGAADELQLRLAWAVYFAISALYLVSIGLFISAERGRERDSAEASLDQATPVS